MRSNIARSRGPGIALAAVALAAVVSLFSLPGCGEAPSADDTATPVAAPLSAGQFCRQNVDGSCMTPGYPVALVSFLCNGQVQTIYSAIQQLNPSNDGVTYVERMFPMSPSFPVNDGFYLDCSIGAQQHGTGLPYWDQQTWNFGTYLRGMGSTACTITRYWHNVSHTVSYGAFINEDMYPSTGGTNHGRINGLISIVNGQTDPSIGLCYGSYSVAFSF